MQKDDFQFMLEDSADVVRKQCLNAIKNLGWKIRSDLTQDYQIFCYVPIADLLPQAPVYSITLYPDDQITYIALVAASDDLSQSHAKNDLPKLKSAIITGKVSHRSPDPTLTDQTEIFVSYSRRDWEKHVEPLVERLRKEGFRVWIDQHLLEGGQDWLDEINGALQRCKAMILCVSPDALESRWVKMEYRFFIREDKPILPLMCRSTTLPAELGGIQYLSPSEADMIVERLRKLTV